MKKHTYVALNVLALFCAGHAAENAVEINPAIPEFVERAKAGTLDAHRTGILGHQPSKDALYRVRDKGGPQALGDTTSPDDDFKAWRKGLHAEYEAIYGRPSGAEKAHLKKHLGGTKLRVESYLEGENVYSIEAPADTAAILAEATRTPLGIDALREKARAHVKAHFPQLQGYIEFANEEVEYTDVGGKTVLTEFRVRYRRLFKGAPISRNASYATFALDNRGELVGARFKWPKLKRSGDEPGPAQVRGIGEGYEEILAKAKAFPSPFRDKLTGQVLPVEKVQLTGMSMAWLPKEEDGKIRIVPSYSVLAKIDIQGGDKLDAFLDCPVSKSRFME